MAKKTTLTAPRDDAPDLPSEFTPADALSRGDLFEGVAFETLHESDGTNASVLESVFRNVSTDDITLSFATINDVEFQDLRVASLRMRGAGLSRVRFIGGRIGTLDLTEARLDAVVLENVRIDYLTLGRATVTDLDIRGSRIDAFDMPAAKAQRVRFTDSEVREFDPREAQVRDVDLRGAQLTMVSDVSALRGMTISPAQAENAAEQFAARLGIAVLD